MTNHSTHYKPGSFRAYRAGCTCPACREGNANRLRAERAKGPRMPKAVAAEAGKRRAPGELECAVIEECRKAGIANGSDFNLAVKLARGCDSAWDDYDKPLYGLFLRTSKQLSEVLARLHKHGRSATARKRATIHKLTSVK